MAMDIPTARKLLAELNLKRLFVEELNWSNTRHPAITIRLDESGYTVTHAAELGGMVVCECSPEPDGSIPDRGKRRAIDHQVSPQAYEHIIVFVDRTRSRSIWTWPKRKGHKFMGLRETTYVRGSSGDPLLQKLDRLDFEFDELNEEGEVSVTTITYRARRAFDVEPVVKRFYNEFCTHHEAFRKFLVGIEKLEDQHWYTSVMLNRLMFIYFIQQKSFLADDPDYLRTRLRSFQDEAENQFYRRFLIPLFFKGFATRMEDRDEETNRLLGNIPYLNGGLFLPHQIERAHGVTPDGGGSLDIPDKAFEGILDFFSKWEWHLDVREERTGREINPDVLGYIFEKYINAIQPGEQKAKGAYYTKEDITGYISRNTIIPFLFDAARKECPGAFKGERSVWRLLQENPDAYIYPAVKLGVVDEQGDVLPESALPDFVQRGMHDPKERMFDKRYNLTEADLRDEQGNRLTLPTETWREYVERRKRCLEVRSKLAAGEVQEINDLITYNLDICQFAKDAIRKCEDDKLLTAFWHAVTRITVLDPTCGSGAFLFAALNILELLYEACLDRMRYFLMQLERSQEKRRPEKFSHFRKELDRVEDHPNRSYFIYKSIILHNLYGVDIMEEAVEICKLRLFLKLVAEVDKDDSKPNFGIEPLPDIDFNIRAGNTLVGFVTRESVRQAVEVTQEGQTRLVFGETEATLKRIDEKAENADRAFRKFQEMQEKHGMDAEDFTGAKANLQSRLSGLTDELNRYLATEYGVDPEKKASYEKWLSSHQPFHWFVEFHGIVKTGGFDAIIGNPPYVELSAVRSDYTVRGFLTEACGNLYALCAERCLGLLRPRGWLGIVVQQPIVSTLRMRTARQALLDACCSLVVSAYDDRPSKLFDGIHHSRNAILIAQKRTVDTAVQLHVSSYNKWYREERPTLFANLHYKLLPAQAIPAYFPKVGSETEVGLLEKLLAIRDPFQRWISSVESGHRVYYKITGVGHWFTITSRAPRFIRGAQESASTREHHVCFPTEAAKDRALPLLNSSLFYWFYQVRTNCRDFNPSDYRTFPVPATLDESDMSELSTRLQTCLDQSGSFIDVKHSRTGSIRVEQFRPRAAKPVIDQIDCVLAKHYGFTGEELDFIINYDIKYRMGLGAGGDGEDEEGE